MDLKDIKKCLKEIPAKDCDYRPEVLDQLDQHMVKVANSEKYYAGSYLIQKQGKIVAARSVGPIRPDKASGVFQTDTLRRAASVTKLFTAIGIVQLIEEGKLHLNQPVCEILKEMDNDCHRKITLHHLLTHTSGLAPDIGSFFEPYPRKWAWDREDWIKAALEGPYRDTPGTEWAYCSIGYSLLGEVIYRTSGIPYDQYIMDRIVKPLGMERTHFTIPEELFPFTSVPDEQQFERVKEKIEPEKAAFLAAGGLWTTAEDFLIFGDMLLKGGEQNGVRIISRRFLEVMTSNCLLPGTRQYQWGFDGMEVKWGLGFNVNCDNILLGGGFSHEGAGRCGLYMDPKDQMIFIYFFPMYKDQWQWQANTAPRNIAWSGIL